ncbi:class I SAM-dependent methyltransferase [Candidatus Micrarchaeota archaeon]|nr:class I SAM-dependent methyltransferase [Candidatus Micrarchaeota archaeon]MBU1930206.1 class I SAM-dependent methyltransferase [Candidatus Micrarchaeota archaeon]
MKSAKSIHRILLDEKLSQAIKEIQGGIVLDAGGKERRYANQIKCSKYVCLDINKKNKPDICCDIHKIPVKTGYFDAIIATEVLEHCYDPKKAVEELRRILKKGGKIIVSTPFILQYHGEKDCLDYWRFSHDGLKELFKDFNQIEITGFGSLSTGVFGLITAKISFLNFLNGFFSKIRLGNLKTGFVAVATK